MKYIKRFNESEIWNGSVHHYNKKSAVIGNIFDEVIMLSFKCNSCFFEFTSKNAEQSTCSICDSDNIEKIIL
jgi:predicted Zn-ribbon and HTH transcriptional regulator